MIRFTRIAGMNSTQTIVEAYYNLGATLRVQNKLN